MGQQLGCKTGCFNKRGVEEVRQSIPGGEWGWVVRGQKGWHPPEEGQKSTSPSLRRCWCLVVLGVRPEGTESGDGALVHCGFHFRGYWSCKVGKVTVGSIHTLPKWAWENSTSTQPRTATKRGLTVGHGEQRGKEEWGLAWQHLIKTLGFPHSSVVKNPPASAGDEASIPGSGRFPGEGNGIWSSILAWSIPWTEELGGLQSMGLQKSQIPLSNKTAPTTPKTLSSGQRPVWSMYPLPLNIHAMKNHSQAGRDHSSQGSW